MLESSRTSEILESCTAQWIEEELADIPKVDDLSIEKLIQGLHGCNFFSWKADDRSRGDLPPQIIVQYKRNLDASNLMRNNFMEAIDALSVEKLSLSHVEDHSNLILNSETLGQMIDRMSVLTLKKAFSNTRLSKTASLEAEKRISEQLLYVQTCYDVFLERLKRKEAYMLAYKQYKMYQPDL
ncbi:DUF4254 domain-containing protein [Ningiella sp. W23]|uniref:DUF4254 domain-containing protein n=1 Tax=Ningiella sp. W23 TaxID=3023715 RepID=UPI00375756F6